jgi:Ice-binding-like
MRLSIFRVLLLVAALSLLAASARAGTIDGFAVLGASTVTNTGPTTINGDLGVYPGTAITNTGGITINGTAYPGDTIVPNNPGAATAWGDASSLYSTDTAPSFLIGADNLTGDDLGSFGPGGLAPGVYYFSSSAGLTGALLLNAEGTDTASWTFVIVSTLTTASASSVAIIDTGSAGAYTGNVDWVVGGSTTLGTTTTFLGTIVSDASDTLNTGATDGCGGVFALDGAVTLDNNTISTGCSVAGTGIPVGAPVAPTPEPGTFALFSCGALGMFLLRFSKLRTRRAKVTP